MGLVEEMDRVIMAGECAGCERAMRESMWDWGKGWIE